MDIADLSRDLGIVRAELTGAIASVASDLAAVRGEQRAGHTDLQRQIAVEVVPRLDRINGTVREHEARLSTIEHERIERDAVAAERRRVIGLARYLPGLWRVAVMGAALAIAAREAMA